MNRLLKWSLAILLILIPALITLGLPTPTHLDDASTDSHNSTLTDTTDHNETQPTPEPEKQNNPQASGKKT